MIDCYGLWSSGWQMFLLKKSIAAAYLSGVETFPQLLDEKLAVIIFPNCLFIETLMGTYIG